MSKLKVTSLNGNRRRSRSALDCGGDRGNYLANMFSVETDSSKRLLVISVAGRVTADEVRQTSQRVSEIAKEMAPGFRVLTDFRWLESMDASAARYVAQIMDTVAAQKVGAIVRVIPDPHKDIGLNILSQFHYGSEVHALTFENLAEALQSLITSS